MVNLAGDDTILKRLAGNPVTKPRDDISLVKSTLSVKVRLNYAG